MSSVIIRLNGVVLDEVMVNGKLHFAITTDAGNTILVEKTAVEINSATAIYFGR